MWLADPNESKVKTPKTRHFISFFMSYDDINQQYRVKGINFSLCDDIYPKMGKNGEKGTYRNAVPFWPSEEKKISYVDSEPWDISVAENEIKKIRAYDGFPSKIRFSKKILFFHEKMGVREAVPYRPGELKKISYADSEPWDISVIENEIKNQGTRNGFPAKIPFSQKIVDLSEKASCDWPIRTSRKWNLPKLVILYHFLCPMMILANNIELKELILANVIIYIQKWVKTEKKARTEMPYTIDRVSKKIFPM